MHCINMYGYIDNIEMISVGGFYVFALNGHSITVGYFLCASEWKKNVMSEIDYGTAVEIINKPLATNHWNSYTHKLCANPVAGIHFSLFVYYSY